MDVKNPDNFRLLRYINLPPHWTTRAGSGFDTFPIEGYQYPGINHNLDQATRCAQYPWNELAWDQAHCRYLMGLYYGLGRGCCGNSSTSIASAFRPSRSGPTTTSACSAGPSQGPRAATGLSFTERLWKIKKAERHTKCCTVTTREVINGESVIENLEFADYDSLKDSCRDYAWLITGEAPYRPAYIRLVGSLSGQENVVRAIVAVATPAHGPLGGL